MQETIMQFFKLVGLSPTAPETFPELLTWFVFVIVSLFLVLGVFHVIGSIVSVFLDFRR